ncbi:MAG: dihydrodipicolinate reductase [Chloroflexi bacterium]|nr:dihydrodipicolinate reductase [Chloroflexota bacterium]
MARKIRVVQFGCGPIGCSIVRLAARKPGFEIVGAIDLVNVGRDLGEVAALHRDIGVKISPNADAVLKETKPDIVLHATGSSLPTIYPQLEQIARAGASVVSSTEELSYPFRKHPELAARIDRLAKENKVAILGTGVNPGFLMDTWPLAMTAVCQDVRHVKVVRIQDASPRRLPFQKKIGAGRTIEEFNKLVAEGTLRHVGLAESIAMIAAGLGWTLDDITETIEPVIAAEEVRSSYITVRPGQAAGVKQVGHGWRKGEEMINLDFQAYIGARESYDAVYITGVPNMEVVIKGGTHGDIATAAMIVNAVPRVLAAPPGLTTMKDLPLVCALPGA